MPTLQNKKSNIDPLFDFWVVTYLIGTICSKAVLSISLGGMVITSLYYLYKKKYPLPSSALAYLAPTILFGITLVSFFNSEDYYIWQGFFFKKLPFLALPLVFYIMGNYVSRRYHNYLWWYVIIVAIASLGVLGNYLMNFEDLNTAIGTGKAITTPIDHTEYSIFVAFAAFVSFFIYQEKRSVLALGNHHIPALIAVFLFIFLHILAVRSGLAVLYITAFIIGLYHYLSRKNYVALTIFLASILSLPFIAVNTIPSLKEKMNYSNWDLKQYKQGTGLSYSDSERIYSLRAGWKVFVDNKVVGVGIGDVREACNDLYRQWIGSPIDHYPHNQYLFTLASTGVVGLVCYLIALLIPLIQFRAVIDIYFLTMHCILLVAALAENALERTYTIGFYLFFLLIGISYFVHRWKSQL